MSNLSLAQGASSSWSAHRIRSEDEGKFDAIKAAKEGRPVPFMGEVCMAIIFSFQLLESVG